MIVEAVYSHPCAVGVVPWPFARSTVVVKITMVPGEARDLVLASARDVEPLRLDTLADSSDELLHPTDFAPYKPQCDVMLVGDSALDRDSGRVAVANLDFQVARGASLAAQASPLPGGDPLLAPELWTANAASFVPFQSARLGARIPHPRAPFWIDVRRGAARMVGRFNGPVPRVSVTSLDGTRMLGRVAIALDSIAVDARRGVVELTFRGLFEHPDPLQKELLVVELVDVGGGDLAEPTWTVVAPTLPSDAAVDGPTSTEDSSEPSRWTDAINDEETTAAPDDRHPTMSFAAPETQDVGLTTVAVLAPAPPAQLPFTRSSAPSRPARFDPDAFVALRAEQRTDVRPASQALDGTVAIGGAVARDVHPLRGLRESEPVVARPEVVSTPRSDAPELPPAEVTPSARRPAVPDAERDLQALLQEVQREVWRGERPAATILADRGVSLDTWRAFRRARGRSASAPP